MYLKETFEDSKSGDQKKFIAGQKTQWTKDKGQENKQ